MTAPTELVGLSFQEYRDYPAIAQSDLKLAYHDPQLYHEQKKGIWPKPPPTNSMQFGVTTETFLRNGPEPVRIWEGSDKRTKGWQEFKKENKGVGKLVSRPEYDETIKIQTAIMDNVSMHTTADYLLRSDKTRRWSTRWTWNMHDIDMKCECDVIMPDDKFIIDIKTTHDETPEEFGKSIVRWGYDVQAAQYLEPFEQQEPWDYYWVAIRNSPPYSVAVYEYDEAWRARGNEWRDKYIEAFKERLDSKKEFWRRSNGQVEFCPIPRWAKGVRDATQF